jgi:multidrug efflux pump subunit AcrA (membrane-fusion protein)
VEAEIPNTDNVLRPGSFAEGVITVNPNAHGVTVPRGALISFAGVERVFIVSNGQLDERVIRSGRRLGDRIEVLDGLKPGEDVVRDATDRMAKGQRVTVTKS